MTKIKVVEKKLNKGLTKKSSLFRKKKIEFMYDKNQGYREKLNKVQEKSRLIRKKLKQRYDKNQGFKKN